MAGKLNELDDDNFKNHIAQGKVLVDFSAEWCGPCKMQTPILEGLVDVLKGTADIVKIDIDKSQKVTAEFGVTSVPTMILFKDGQEVERIVGLRDADSLKSLIEGA